MISGLTTDLKYGHQLCGAESLMFQNEALRPSARLMMMAMTVKAL
jgi:hypothetical protein